MVMCRMRSGQSGSLPVHAAGENARLMSAQALGTVAGNKTGRMMSSGNRKPSGA